MVSGRDIVCSWDLCKLDRAWGADLVDVFDEPTYFSGALFMLAIGNPIWAQLCL